MESTPSICPRCGKPDIYDPTHARICPTCALTLALSCGGKQRALYLPPDKDPFESP